MSTKNNYDERSDLDEDDLDEDDLGTELDDEREARWMKRRQLEERQTECVGIVASIAMSQDIRTIRVHDVVPFLLRALGADGRNTSHKSNIANQYAEQLELAISLGQVKLLSPDSLLEEKREALPWEDVQQHFIARMQLEAFALMRLGIDITDENDAVDLAVGNNVIAALNKRNPYYSTELDLALRAWHAVTIASTPDTKQAAKKHIIDWLNSNAQSLSDEAKERIAKVCNWNKRGGAPGSDK